MTFYDTAQVNSILNDKVGNEIRGSQLDAPIIHYDVMTKLLYVPVAGTIGMDDYEATTRKSGESEDTMGGPGSTGIIGTSSLFMMR